MNHKFEGKIAFLGAGAIAETWMERFILSGCCAPEQILATDIRKEPLERLASRWSIRTSPRNAEAAAFGDVVVLAVPPPEALPVVREVGEHLCAAQLLVSLAAALPLGALEAALPGRSIVRVMPNTPALVGAGTNLVVFGGVTGAVDRKRLAKLLDVLGRWSEVADEEVDQWCALCAVGPTFFLPLLDELARAAAHHGLPPEAALHGAAQTMAGTARMVLESGRTPEQLKQMIGLRTLKEEAARRLFAEAYDSAIQKLKALGEKVAGVAAPAG